MTPATLVPSWVASALGGAAPTWSYTELTHNQDNQATDGIWRVTGPDGSAVLKVCVPKGSGSWQTSPEPRHWNHWRREPLAYRDGLTATVFADAGIDGPRLLAADERADGSFALWLEDVTGVPGSQWPVERLAAFAHGLGFAQARWTGRLPAEPWLSRGWLRQYVESKSLPAELPWDLPDAAAVWPAALRTGLRRMWEQRDTLLAAAESGPRTLCHLDVWPLNLIAQNDSPAHSPGAPAARPAGGRTVLLDWAFVGEGAVGEDIANLIPDCVADGLIPGALLPEISAAVIEGYLAGARDAGAALGEDELRRSVAAAGAAKYCWLAPLMLTRLAVGGRVGSAAYDVDHDPLAVLRRRTGLFEHLVSWSEQILSPAR
ncbi:aminoglycoside phosphotransferase [Streptomyces sp. NPDC087422]|uniref:aminoglycoside phosphotransferase n=1 Tax=Streptomyces sp. NPDC087422 TaxID=3365786 RepID=UPI003818B2BC